MNISFINNNKLTRKELFNNAENISKTIQLNDSVYKYNFLYIEADTNLHYALVPIFKKDQNYFRGTGGWSGTSSPNVGTTAIIGDISNDGKTLTINGFLSMVHNSNGNNAESIERFCKKVIGIR